MPASEPKSSRSALAVLANLFAQTEALAFGRSAEEAAAGGAPAALVPPRDADITGFAIVAGHAAFSSRAVRKLLTVSRPIVQGCSANPSGGP